MKVVMSGNEAIARGAWEAGLVFAAAYPGTPSTEILEYCGRYPEVRAQWSTNEKVALEAAAGAAIGGARALAAMKHVGLNVAADPFFTLSYTGVNGGLVVISADDPGMHSSQNEQDNRHYARAAKVPMLEPADSAEAHAWMRHAFDLSEAYDTPVLYRITTRICHAQGVVEPGERTPVPVRPYAKDFAKYVMLPSNARARHPLVEQRARRLMADGRLHALFNRAELRDGEIGFVASSVCYQYVREAFPEASVLKLGFTWPLAADLVADFARKVRRLIVVEECDPYLEEQIRAAGIGVDHGKDIIPIEGELSSDIVREAVTARQPVRLTTGVPVPKRPPALCPGCGHRGMFHVLNKEKATVFSDIGCYTLAGYAPQSALETCICMGASVSASIGMVRARQGADEKKRRMACAIGDSTFLHSGITGLIDAVHNKVPFVTVILDNGVTAMTGHQNNPATGLTLAGEQTVTVDLEALCRACGVRHVDVVDPDDLKGTREVVQRHWGYDEPSVIIARKPCVVHKRIRETPWQVDRELCRACKMCLKIGCPAVIFDEKSSIDESLCTGCSVCAQVCPFEAIRITGGTRA